MATHPNARIARRVWLAASRGDLETIRELTAPDLVWHTGGRRSWAGTKQGRETVLSFLERYGERSDEYISDLQDVLASDERAIVLFHVSGRRGDKKLDVDYALHCRIAEGRITEIRAVPNDQYAVDEFWA